MFHIIASHWLLFFLSAQSAADVMNAILVPGLKNRSMDNILKSFNKLHKDKVEASLERISQLRTQPWMPELNQKKYCCKQRHKARKISINRIQQYHRINTANTTHQWGISTAKTTLRVTITAGAKHWRRRSTRNSNWTLLCLPCVATNSSKVSEMDQSLS